MIIKENVSLQPFNTFGVEAQATHFAEVFSEAELTAAIQAGIHPVWILGGGSNVLFTEDPSGLVVRIRIPGRQALEKTDDQVVVEAGAGENWHDFVLWTLENDWCGLENLALIPGNVGAAPIQNIGAYGVELKDVFHSLDALDMRTGEKRTFTGEDCAFGYRDSVFKQHLKGQYAITSVRFLLRPSGAVNTTYGALAAVLSERGIAAPTCRDVAEAVMHIRRSKLPDPAVLGNAGSFFKNPEIDRVHFQKLQAAFPDIVAFPLANGKVKVPAGWLIDQAGFRGKREGNVGSYEKQALVMVNFGGATGREILEFTRQVATSVKRQFGIALEPEVQVVGSR